jgi:hypothetical protein
VTSVGCGKQGTGLSDVRKWSDVEQNPIKALDKGQLKCYTKIYRKLQGASFRTLAKVAPNLRKGEGEIGYGIQRLLQDFRGR